MADYEGVSPEAAFLASHHRHVLHVSEALLAIRQELARRAHVHDRSKLSPEEMPGFVRINATAREHPYGSPEYRAAIRAEQPTVDRHTRWNSHHPEAHLGGFDAPRSMGWLDIIEMVCDWQGASRTYGVTDWNEVLDKQRARFAWTPEQWWLIEEVSAFLKEIP